MIQNNTTKETLVTHHKELYGVLEMSFGLMFRKRLHDTGWVFVCPKTSRWDLTNLFVFQSIDVLWLNKDRRVLKKVCMRPFVLFQKGIANTRYIIELPKESAKNVSVGDHITWDKKAL